MKRNPNGNIDGLIHAFNQESLKHDFRSSRDSSINSSPSSRASTISLGEVNTPSPPMHYNNNNNVQSQSLSPMDLLTTRFNNIRTNDTTNEKLCVHLAQLFIYLQDITIKASYDARQILLIASKNTMSIIYNSIKIIILLIFQIIKEESTKIVKSTIFRGMTFIILFMMSTQWGRNILTNAYYIIAHILNYKEIYGVVASFFSSIALIKNMFTGIETFHLTQQQYNNRIENQLAGMQTQITSLQSQNQVMSSKLQLIGDSQHNQLQILNDIDSKNHIGNLQLEELGFKSNELLALSNSNNQGLLDTYFKVESVDNQVTQLKMQLITLFEITKDIDDNHAKQFDKIIEKQGNIVTNMNKLSTENIDMLKLMIQNSGDVEQLLHNMQDKSYIKLMSAILKSTNINANDIVDYLGFFQNYITFTPNPQIRNGYFTGGKRKTKSRNDKLKTHLKRKKKDHNSRKK